ncbi:MAG: argininosuccinate lyase [Nitrosopumilus sp.]|nr:argininosuccinate lyase [Nitrosopumilus sp.]
MYRARMGGGMGDGPLGYVSSMADDAELLMYDIDGSRAHVLMLEARRIIPRRDAGRILAALSRAEAGVPAGRAEDIHEALEAAVVRRAGRESGGRMHTGRSRNDQVALDMRMKVRDDTNAICGMALDLAGALVGVASAHKRTAMPLYTHMQQAQPGLLSHYMISQADALLRDEERLSGSYARTNKSPLGAGPAGGTAIPVDRAMVARLLGFDGIVENSLDAAGSRDFAAEYVSVLAIMMANLSRLAEDMVVWSTSEFGFVELADEFASPSSVMPQKKNPDVLELTRGRAGRVLGDLVAVISSYKGLASGYGRDLQEAKGAVFSATRIASGALPVLGSLVSTARFDRARMLEAAESGGITALDVSDALVRAGVPFRTTHGIAGSLSRLAHEAGVPVTGVGIREAGIAARGTGVDPRAVLGAARSATVEASLRARASAGSAGYSAQAGMVSSRRREIAARKRRLAARSRRVAAAVSAMRKRARR